MSAPPPRFTILTDPPPPLLTVKVTAQGHMQCQTALPVQGTPLIVVRLPGDKVMVLGLQDRASAMALLADAIATVGAHYAERTDPPRVIEPPVGGRLHLR